MWPPALPSPSCWCTDVNARRFVLPCIAVLLLSAGCLVRSVHPWLSDESRVAEPSLAGAWRDDNAKTTAVFTGEKGSYTLDVTDRQQESSHLTASLHCIGNTLLLQISPSEPEGFNAFALLPAHILYKVRLEKDTLTLVPVDLETFESRAAEAGLSLLAEGSNDNGYVLTGSPEDVQAFLIRQVEAPGFFASTPHYRLTRQPPGAEPLPATPSPH